MNDISFEYIKRVCDSELELKLEAFGAVHIVGPKWYGKTTTAKQYAKSYIEMQDPDKRDMYMETAKIKPSNLLMLFADYILEWLEIAKGRLAIATYSSYLGLIKSVIEPYFRKKKLTLRELEARHLQMFYSEQLKKVKPNTVIHYHAVIHSALKYAVKTDMLSREKVLLSAKNIIALFQKSLERL